MNGACCHRDDALKWTVLLTAMRSAARLSRCPSSIASSLPKKHVFSRIGPTCSTFGGFFEALLAFALVT